MYIFCAFENATERYLTKPNAAHPNNIITSSTHLHEPQAETPMPHPFPLIPIPHHPTTLLSLNPSKNPARSSRRTSTTACSKLSIRTRAPVAATTS